MFTDVIKRIKKIFGVDSIKKTEIEQAEELGYVIKYEDVSEFNITSIISNKLSNIVCSEASGEIIPVEQDNNYKSDKNHKNGRIIFLNESLQRCLSKLHLIAARTFGTGGVVLKPYVYNGEIYADIVPQNRFFVIDQVGEVITKAGFLADIFCDALKKSTYMRIEYHSLDADNNYTIENKAVIIGESKYSKDFRDFKEIAMSKTPWANIAVKITISNVKQMLFAFVKCPTDNKKDSNLTNSIYGVPITYGQDKLIKMILDLLNEIPDEYRNKKAFIGADDLMFDSDNKLPESGLYKLFRGTGSVDNGSFWEVFSPAIRHKSYFEGLDYLFGLLEKAVAVNKGMLTDLSVSNATATAIKRSTLDTFSTVDAMRKNIEEAFKRLVYAFDVISDAFDLCETCERDLSDINKKEYELKFDWNYRLIEDSAETWKQLVEGYDKGAVNLDELRMYLFNEDRKTARFLNKKDSGENFNKEKERR